MLQIIATEDSHPPLYYILLKGWSTLFSYNIFFTRLLSLAGLMGLAALGLGPVKRLLGKTTALWFMTLTLFSPFSFWVALDMRMYSIACLFTTGALIYACLLISNTRVKGDFIKLTLFSLAAMYTHHYAMIAVFFIYLFLGAVFLIRKNKLDLLCYVFSGSLLVLAYLPELYFTLHHAQERGPKLILDINFLKDSFKVLFLPTPFTFLYLGLVVSFALICGWVAWLTFLLDYKNEFKTHAYKTALFAFLILCSVILSVVLVSFICRPIIAWRYYLPLMGCLCLGVSIALTKEKRIAILFGGLFMLSFIICYMQKNEVVFDKTYQTMDTYINQYVTPEDVIVANSLASYFHVFYFLPHQKVFFNPKNKDTDLAYLMEDLNFWTEENIKQAKNIYALNEDLCIEQGISFYSNYDGYSYCLQKMNFSLEKK